jgi:hypothetical protein
MGIQNFAMLLTLLKDGYTYVINIGEEFFSSFVDTEELSKTAKESLNAVIYTSEKFLASINNASNACFAGVIDIGEDKNNGISLRIIYKKQN